MKMNKSWGSFLVRPRHRTVLSPDHIHVLAQVGVLQPPQRRLEPAKDLDGVGGEGKPVAAAGLDGVEGGGESGDAEEGREGEGRGSNPSPHG